MDFPSLPIEPVAGVQLPTTTLITKAIAFTQEHTTVATHNHVLRSTFFALVISRKIPDLHSVDPEVLALITILHDLGWDYTGALVSADMRFEVDGADAARKFLRERAVDWDKHKLQLVWDGIALHTTPSIARFKEPEVAAASYGIIADFLGPNMPGGLLSHEECEAIVKAFPRAGFLRELKGIMCNLCKTKPETTYDNFVAQFGQKYVEGYSMEGKEIINMIENGWQNM